VTMLKLSQTAAVYVWLLRILVSPSNKNHLAEYFRYFPSLFLMDQRKYNLNLMLV